MASTPDMTHPHLSRRKLEEPEPSCLSMKSDYSVERYIDFKGQQPSAAERRKLEEPEPSCLSMKSDYSVGRYIDFKGQQPSAAESSSTEVDQELKVPSAAGENIVTFVKKELKRCRVLSPDYPECRGESEDEGVGPGEDDRGGAAEEFLKITR
ncbi:protein NLRC3-like protein [Lates japonicus]|uniref:Protein NLRC3-like protein n=1 Tax=Lates japonicus TaxID=270547 RepID=A0AAD3N870_LATJO|nr:protein NLRC3-like protein [Lates japonicus]